MTGSADAEHEMEALAWVARLASGGATEADGLRLAHWRAQSPDHEAAFTAARRLWRDIGHAEKATVLQVAAVPARRGGDVRAARGRGLDRRRVVTGAVGIGIAASVAVVVTQTGLLSTSAYAADYETGPGDRRTISPAEGVTITLNTRSRLVQPDGRDARAYRLLRGEAAVEVGGAPISVALRDATVSADQANFIVRDFDGAPQAVCLSGEIQVALGGESRTLGPAQQLSWTRNRFSPTVPADVEAEAAWRRGLLVFRDRSLPSVVEELNRYSDARIMVVGGRLRAKRITGVFHLDRSNDVLSHMQVAFDARLQRLPGLIVLS